MRDLWSLNVKVIAFDSEDPIVSEAALHELSPSIEGTLEEVCIGSAPGRMLLEGADVHPLQMTWILTGFAIFHSRACGVHPGYQCLPLSCHPVSYNANPTHSVWQPQVLQPHCQVSFSLLGRQIELESVHIPQSCNIWEGI